MICTGAPPVIDATVFDQWVGDTEHLLDVYAPCTIAIIPDHDITVTATYDWAISLDVYNGTGSGTYTEGRTVSIAANDPPDGDLFKQWVGHTAYVADPLSSTTDVNMPSAGVGDIAVTATYLECWDGDLNTNLVVDIVDLNMVLIDWGKTGGFADPRSDGNGDGTVSIIDLNMVLIDWGKTGYQP